MNTVQYIELRHLTKTFRREDTLRLGPLSGIRVLDLRRVLARLFCTMILADLGAEVIETEERFTGDETRTTSPFVEGARALVP